MIAPYRRDFVAKSFMRFAEILFAAFFVSSWVHPLAAIYKLALGVGVVVVFVLGIAFCPASPPQKGG